MTFASNDIHLSSSNESPLEELHTKVGSHPVQNNAKMRHPYRLLSILLFLSFFATAVFSSFSTYHNFLFIVSENKRGKDDRFPEYAPANSPGKSKDVDTQSNNLQSPWNGNTLAADTLECRSSVLEFVINATDVKDECEGLRKAFDETCSHDHHVSSKSKDGAEDGDKSSEKQQKKRRLLSATNEAEVYHWRWNTPIIYITKMYRTYTSRLFVEDKVIDENQWRKASIQIDNGYDTTDEYLSRARKMMSGFDNTVKSGDYMDHHRNLLENVSELANNTSMKEHSSSSEEDLKKKEHILSPSLPTSSEHVGDQMLNDAIEINEETIAEVIKHLNANSTEHNSLSKTEAEASSEAISTATAVVSAVLNSPASVEARKCCASIMSVFHNECDLPERNDYNDKKLFIIVCVIALCGMVKSLIRHYKLRWMPEAGGCILVGVVGGIILQFLPHIDFAFHHEVFLRIMVPPIVFEAALNIDKRSFMRMAIPITIYAVFGTLMSTVLTAAIIYYGTTALGSWCTSIPFIESLIFGALISSIDPIAVLSVLSNLGMNDKDTIYVLIFGESLLNDGVAIVLFQTLLKFLDKNLVIDSEAVWEGAIHFLVIAFGSLFVGVTCGAIATIYFYCMKGIQTPLVEVLMFLCWAFIPYYICDGVEWSGIVSIVAAGFFMDIYVVGSRLELQSSEEDSHSSLNEEVLAQQHNLFQRFFSQEGFLSTKAKNHIGFVTEINATLMETAIFSYLGIFLFSKRYHWGFWIPTMAIVSCVLSRSIMVFSLSRVANLLNRIKWRKLTNLCVDRPEASLVTSNTTIIDSKMQIVLIFAGLRGAMSFALVETIPLFDHVTGQGSRFKPELKAMTSAAIVFTVFVFGGYTFYLLERVGMSVGNKNATDQIELKSLMKSDMDNKRKRKQATLTHRTSRGYP